MTVNLRSLRIAPDFDATKYVAGIAQKNAAERETVQASMQAGKAAEDLKIKVSSTIPVIERMSRTYIDGYGTAQKFNAEILRLARTQDTNATSAAQLEQIYSGLQRRFGLVADAQELAQRGYTGLAVAIASVNDKLAIQDNMPAESALAARAQQLRAAFDADYVSAQRLTSELQDLAEAERLGVTLSGGYEAALNSLVEKHDAVAAAARRQREEYARLAQEGRDALRADQSQTGFNALLGVGAPRSSARESASVFQEDMARLDQEIARREELDRLRGTQNGATFNADLNQRLGVGAVGGSARDSASVFQQEFARLEEMQKLFAEQAGSAFTADLNARLGIDGAGTSAKASASVFEEAAREAEVFEKRALALRAQIDPVGTAQARLNAELAEYAALAERAQITTLELAQAQNLARSRFEATKAAVDAANDPAAISHRELNGLNVANAGFQLQDIAVTAAMGMNPATIGLQQGLQLAGAVGSMEKPVAGIAAAFGSLISPTTLATVGFTTAAAAAIQFGMGLAGAEDESKKLDKALEHNQTTLKMLETRYGALIAQAKGYSADGAGLLSFQTSSDVRGLRNATKVAGEDFFSEVGTLTRGGYRADNENFGSGFMAFNDAITQLRNGFKAGRPDFEAFYDSLYKTAELNPEYAKKADELGRLIEKFREGSKALDEMERVQQAVTNTAGRDYGRAGGRFLNDQISRQLAMRREFEEQSASINARTPQERVEAARMRERNMFDPLESIETRNMREEQAGALELLQIERKRQDSAEQRARTRETSIAQQQIEIAAIGQTADRVTMLQTQYGLLSQLREEAVQNGIRTEQEFQNVYAKEIDLIRQHAEELKRLKAIQAEATLRNDVSFEMQQLGRTDREQGIASLLNGAGLDVDMRSQNAALLRNLEILREQKKAWEDIRDVGKDAVDQIVDSATGGFESISDVFDGIAKDVLKQFTTLGVANPLKNAIFGGELPTMDTVGGIGGIFKALTGGSNPALDAASRSVGAMSVTAASVVVNGGVGSAVSSLAGQAANQNDPFAAVLSNDPATYGSGDKLAWNFWKSKGLSDHQVAGVLGNIKAESAFNPAAIGDGGAAKGLYQWNDRGPSMIGAVGADWKSNPLAQHEFAYKELMGPENRAWKALLASQDTKGATAAFAGFERPSGFSWDNPEAAHNFVGRLNGANEALSKFGGTTNVATQGLGTLGNGFGQIGNALAQGGAAAPSGGGGGGLFGWLGSLFGGGGVSPMSSAWAANTTYSNYLAGIPGFAVGTGSAPSGFALVGEKGPEVVRFRGGEQVIPNDRIGSIQMPTANAPTVLVKPTVINNSSANVETRETRDENGGRGVEFVISDRMATAASKRGGAFDRQLRARGMSAPRPRR